MAEGWARHLAGDKAQVASAGIQPFGVHPLAVSSMAEIGIDIAHHISRRLDERLINWADHIVTMADSVKPYSSYFPDKVIHHHWSILNPETMVYQDVSHEEAFANIRDEIRERVTRLLIEIAEE
jgi:arsenate reductase